MAGTTQQEVNGRNYTTGSAWQVHNRKYMAGTQQEVHNGKYMTGSTQREAYNMLDEHNRNMQKVLQMHDKSLMGHATRSKCKDAIVQWEH
jgi:hypothetical protein